MKTRGCLSIFVLFILYMVCCIRGFSLHFTKMKAIAKYHHLAAAANENDGDNLNERRKRRRQTIKPKAESSISKKPSATLPVDAIKTSKTAIPLNSKQSITRADDDDQRETTIEERFGLGDNQLKELMDLELPVPREELLTGKVIDEEEDKKDDKVFRLPELSDFLTDKKEKDVKRANEIPVDLRVDRNNREEYLRLLQLNPFADADETLFKEEYDIIPSLFGTGKLLNIPVPYLQAGHGMLIVILSLSSNVYYPGNPLTELPIELREFLKQTLLIVFGINSVLAGQALFQAKKRRLPPLFWAIKTFIFGGIAYYELSQTQDPTTVKPSSPKKNNKTVNR